MMLIVDGSYYVARAQARMANLSNSDGFPTGGIYGGLNMIGSDLSKCAPDYACVVFDNAKDVSTPARCEIYPDYKSNRVPKTKEDKKASEIKHRSRKVVLDVLNFCGIRSVFAHKGWEADDTIASLASCASRKGQKVLITTGDKDLSALVSNNVKVLDTKTTDGNSVKDYWREALNPKGVEDKYGVPPGRILDLLALHGDAVDGIPGVPGFTRDTAAALIKEYGSLQKVHRAFVAGNDLGINRKKAEGTLDNVKFLKRNLKLVQLNCDLIEEDDFNLDSYAINTQLKTRANAVALLQEEFQFKNIPQSLLKYLDSDKKMTAFKQRASMFD